MCVTLAGIVISVSAVQFLNAQTPILVTPSDIVTLVSAVQCSNTLLPVLVMLDGIVMLFNAVQLSNARSSMLVTLAGIVISGSAVQFLNALSPMLVTLSEIVTLVNIEQSRNVKRPMLVTPSSITAVLMLARLLYHGISEIFFGLAISPVPEMVSVPSLSSTHVTFSPHVPDATLAAPTGIVKPENSPTIMHTQSIKDRIRFIIFLSPFSPIYKFGLSYHNPPQITRKKYTSPLRGKAPQRTQNKAFPHF